VTRSKPLKIAAATKINRPPPRDNVACGLSPET